MGGAQSVTITPEMLQQELQQREIAGREPSFLSRTMPKLAKLCTFSSAPPLIALGVSINVIICIKNYRSSNTLDDPNVIRALDEFFHAADLLKTAVAEFSKVCDYSESERRNPAIQKVMQDLGNNLQTLSTSLSEASASVKPQASKGALGLRKKWEFNTEKIKTAKEKLNFCTKVFEIQCQALSMVVHVDNASNLAVLNEKMDNLSINNKIAEENAILRDQQEQQLKKDVKKLEYTKKLTELLKDQLIAISKSCGLKCQAALTKGVLAEALASYCVDNPGTFEAITEKSNPPPSSATPFPPSFQQTGNSSPFVKPASTFPQPAVPSPFPPAKPTSSFPQSAVPSPFPQAKPLSPFSQPAKPSPFPQPAVPSPFPPAKPTSSFPQPAVPSPFPPANPVSPFSQPTKPVSPFSQPAKPISPFPGTAPQSPFSKPPTTPSFAQPTKPVSPFSQPAKPISPFPGNAPQSPFSKAPAFPQTGNQPFQSTAQNQHW